MLLYVAHKDDQGNTNRHFSPERPDLQNIRLFENFYFWLGSTQVKYYDLEVKDDYVECHIDVMVDSTWKTITKPNEKRKYSFNGLQKLTEDSHIASYQSKGVSYTLMMYFNINSTSKISEYKRDNKNNISKAEAELLAAYA
ncbi:TPA: hypothetical protein ACJXXT_000185 [Pseudomonas aeruginosa]